MSDSKIILPGKSIISLKEHFGAKGYDGNDVLALIAGPGKPDEAIIADIKATIKNFSYRLAEGETPLVATAAIKDSAINSFRQSMKRTVLKIIEETPGNELCTHLDLMANAGLLDVATRRQLRGDIFEQFAKQARGPDVIILGDLDKMALNDPAQRFLDGAFFNGAVASVNGYDKGHVMEHLSALREERPSPHRAKIIPLQPRS